MLGVRGSSGPRGGRGLLRVTPAWGAQRSNTEPRGVGTGGREVKKHRTMAGGQGQGESGRGGGGRCRGTSRERHSVAVPSAGGAGRSQHRAQWLPWHCTITGQLQGPRVSFPRDHPAHNSLLGCFGCSSRDRNTDDLNAHLVRAII